MQVTQTIPGEAENAKFPTGACSVEVREQGSGLQGSGLQGSAEAAVRTRRVPGADRVLLGGGLARRTEGAGAPKDSEKERVWWVDWGPIP